MVSKHKECGGRRTAKRADRWKRWDEDGHPNKDDDGQQSEDGLVNKRWYTK